MVLVEPAEIPAPDENNEWRLDTPGSTGWERSPHPEAADKYFMVSTDGHAQEPPTLWAERIDEKYFACTRVPCQRWISGRVGRVYFNVNTFEVTISRRSPEFVPEDF